MRAGRLLGWLLLLAATLLPSSTRAEIETPKVDPRAPLVVRAESSTRWREGAYEVWHLRGNCEVRQAELSARANEAVLWIDRAEAFSGRPDHVIAYFEGSVSVERLRGGGDARNAARDASRRGADSMIAEDWLARFNTTAGIHTQTPVDAAAPSVPPRVYERGVEARQAELRALVQPVQYNAPVAGGAGGSAVGAGPGGGSSGPRRVTVTPRGTGALQIKSFNNPERNEQIAIIDQGARLMVEGVEDTQFGGGGKIDVEADRIVVWAAGMEGLNFTGPQTQSGDRPLEVYMEGNIVFRQGSRVIYAERMYYNVATDSGTILNAEILTPVPSYMGLLRLKSDVIQQLNQQQFVAYGAALTGSRLGVPRYWFQGQNVTFNDTQTPVSNFFTGQPVIDPATGEQAINHQMLATSRNNFLYAMGLPVFYWPILATDLTEPTYYLNKIGIRNDNIFGTQLLLNFNAYQLFGIRNAPYGTKWQLSTDYLSHRGPAGGTNFRWNRGDIFGIPGPAFGFIDFWGVHDTGLDTLGLDRIGLVPERINRGRILARHRQDLANGMQFTGEFGLISDRNFLEEYFEKEWDQLKDESTDAMLRQTMGSHSWDVLGAVRLNNFFTQTEWLPRGDLFTLGRSLLGDRFTWYGHTSAGYARLRVAVPPTNPIDAQKFLLMAWEVPANAVRAGTRQEIDMPLNAGPVKVVPFVMGDATYWGKDVNGNSVTRLLGQAGVRARLPMWRVDRDVKSVLFNLNGLAHKVTFSNDFLWADSNQNLQQFQLYDPIDDNAVEFFRRRYPFDLFGGAPIPLKFDPRYLALRSGMQGFVTAPSAEIADNLLINRVGVHQRWQTKRGLPGQQRIVDWIVLDMEGTFFPNANRDDFGSSFGLLNYNFRWYLGDRFSVLSDGFYDTFAGGLKTVTIGGIITQPEYGNLYVGYRSLQGPINSSILTGSVSYRMSEKWIASGGSSVDFGQAVNIGQSIAFTRIGESALMQVGVNVNPLRKNFGLVFSIAPRFLPLNGLGRVGGVQIPPAGARGLE